MAQNTIVATTPLGDALRNLAYIADVARIDDNLVHPSHAAFQVTVRTSEDVHRFARRTGTGVKTWEHGATWVTYAATPDPISFAVISLEPVPRELRRPTDTTEHLEEQGS